MSGWPSITCSVRELCRFPGRIPASPGRHMWEVLLQVYCCFRCLIRQKYGFSLDLQLGFRREMTVIAVQSAIGSGQWYYRRKENMTVASILADKGGDVVTGKPEHTLQEISCNTGKTQDRCDCHSRKRTGMFAALHPSAMWFARLRAGRNCTCHSDFILHDEKGDFLHT